MADAAPDMRMSLHDTATMVLLSDFGFWRVL